MPAALLCTTASPFDSAIALRYCIGCMNFSIRPARGSPFKVGSILTYL
jgi:hypothetical protein